MKKILISFIILATSILIGRHIAADIKQEERIIVLENQMAELYLRQAEQGNYAEVDSIDEIHVYNSNNKKLAIKETNNYHKNLKESKIENGIKQAGNNKQTYEANQTDSKKERSFLGNEKFPSPILCELNTIDSATLTRIPGIGGKTAAVIIRYREQLGGFYSPRQLEEKLTWDSAIQQMDEWCEKWMKADGRLIKKMQVNSAEFKQLLKHPYLSYEQVKAIVNYRDKHKKIEGINAFEMMEEFTEEDIERLKPYLAFD